MDIKDYYYSDKYEDYKKAYVVAMAESYTKDNQIQTYFYIFCPLKEKIVINSLIYKINGIEKRYENASVPTRSNNGLYKYKGFVYDYTQTAIIEITNINFGYEVEDDPSIFSDPQIHIYTFDSESGFKAANKHSLLNNSFSCELNYNSLIIIENQTVVKKRVSPDNNFWNANAILFQATLGGSISGADLRFYNFDFPNNIKPDSIEYAKFIYDTYHYHLKRNGEIETTLISMGQVHEIIPESRFVKASGKSQKLEFQTFVLGNRIKKGEFGTLEFTNDEKTKFDYDCSILLEMLPREKKTHKVYDGSLGSYIVRYENEKWYSEIDNVEMLELHYRKDGILYNCQVVSKPIQKDEFEEVKGTTKEQSFWEKIIKWIEDNLPYSILAILCIPAVPIIIVLMAIFCPNILFKIINFVINSFVFIIKFIFKFIFILFKIITLPFSIFKKKKE